MSVEVYTSPSRGVPTFVLAAVDIPDKNQAATAFGIRFTARNVVRVQVLDLDDVVERMGHLTAKGFLAGQTMAQGALFAPDRVYGILYEVV